MLEKDIEKVLVSEDEIEAITVRLGQQITNDYQGKKPIIVGLLKGCMPFMAQLIKHIDLYCQIELMGVASYHGGVASSGDVKITKDLDTPVIDRDVLIAEDIVDTAKTIDIIRNLLLHRGAKSVEVVTLLDKPSGRVIPFVPKYIGVSIPKEFVVGFGLDYDEYYRNLPYVGILKQSVYKK
jgi:hypoxanthine phosphoribosyltransferase/bifunctional protein TilS/HprT